jgi:hypothetical protein
VGAPTGGLAPTALLVLGAPLRGVGVALADLLVLDAELVGGATLELITAALATEVVGSAGAVDGCPEVGRAIGWPAMWKPITAIKLSAQAAPTTKLAKIPFAERLRLRSPLMAAHVTTNE